MEWESSTSSAPRYVHGNRHLSTGMGSMMWRLAIRRPVDQQGAIHAHKLPGTLGGAFAVKTFAKQRQSLHIRLQMDNTTAVAYINMMGGTQSSTLLNMVCSLWQWCLQGGITLSAEHLPGVHNTTVDASSRTFHSSAEWQVLPSVVRRNNTLLGPC